VILPAVQSLRLASTEREWLGGEPAGGGVWVGDWADECEGEVAWFEEGFGEGVDGFRGDGFEAAVVVVDGDPAAVEEEAFGHGGHVAGRGFEGHADGGGGVLEGFGEGAAADWFGGEAEEFGAEGFEGAFEFIWVDACEDVEEAGVVEGSDVGADVVAEAEIFAEGGPEKGAGVFAEEDIEEPEGGGVWGVAAGGVDGDGELDLVDVAVFADDGGVAAGSGFEGAERWFATGGEGITGGGFDGFLDFFEGDAACGGEDRVAGTEP
jgi:hypothetical protein